MRRMTPSLLLVCSQTPKQWPKIQWCPNLMAHFSPVLAGTNKKSCSQIVVWSAHHWIISLSGINKLCQLNKIRRKRHMCRVFYQLEKIQRIKIWQWWMSAVRIPTGFSRGNRGLIVLKVHTGLEWVMENYWFNNKYRHPHKHGLLEHKDSNEKNFSFIIIF